MAMATLTMQHSRKAQTEELLKDGLAATVVCTNKLDLLLHGRPA